VNAFRPVVVAVLALLAAGCAGTWKTYMPDIQQFGVYKLDINQGNYLTQDMVEKLRVGQTRTQVRQTLGTPLLTSAFHDNRWDYVYQYSRAGKRVEQRSFTVYFVDDKLARWEGDELPVSTAQLNRVAADRTLAPEPSADDKGYLQRFLDILKGNW
jgi:outer membrane protein assembly factor BamE